MRVGVGLPTTTPGADGRLVVEWARRVDQAGFTSVGVLDRVLYDSMEPMVALATAGAVTSRVRLVAMVVIGPLRNTALLAKQAATVDLVSSGRLVLGLAIGARHDDYRACGVDSSRRGSALSAQLVALRELWEDGTIGPPPAQPGGPELLVGGTDDRALLRMARYGDGYVHGGGPPRAFAGAVSRVRAAWADVGRPGEPRLWGQGYFALGDPEAGAAYLRDYYAFTGAFAEKVVAGNLTTPEAIRDFVRGYREAGCDELVLFPTVSDSAEVDRLAEILA